MSLAVETLLERVADAVLAVDASAHEQEVGAELTLAESPFSAMDTPDSIAHLSFVVAWSRSPVSDADRASAGREVWVDTELEVQVAYHLRLGVQQEDLRSAAALSTAIARTLNADNWGDPDAVTEVVDLGIPMIMPDAPYALIRIPFRVHHAVEL